MFKYFRADVGYSVPMGVLDAGMVLKADSLAVHSPARPVSQEDTLTTHRERPVATQRHHTRPQDTSQGGQWLSLALTVHVVYNRENN